MCMSYHEPRRAEWRVLTEFDISIVERHVAYKLLDFNVFAVALPTVYPIVSPQRTKFFSYRRKEPNSSGPGEKCFMT